MNGITYSNLINGLKKANVVINRKMLAEIAVSDPKSIYRNSRNSKKKHKTLKRAVHRTALSARLTLGYNNC